VLPVQINLCQEHLFLDQLTHNMTKDCSLIYQFSTCKLQAQNMGWTCSVHKLFWMSKQKQKTICVHKMFSPCSELVVFMYWTGKSMNNLLSYCGLVYVRINASDKDLPVPQIQLYLTRWQYPLINYLVLKHFWKVFRTVCYVTAPSFIHLWKWSYITNCLEFRV
jgi:hypothetical protein